MKRILSDPITVFIVVILGLGVVPLFFQNPQADATAVCNHQWISGGFYAKACEVGDCPQLNPPTMTVRLEHCKICGIVRIPKIIRNVKW